MVTIILVSFSLLVGVLIGKEYVKIAERRKRHNNQYINTLRLLKSK